MSNFASYTPPTHLVTVHLCTSCSLHSLAKPNPSYNCNIITVTFIRHSFVAQSAAATILRLRPIEPISTQPGGDLNGTVTITAFNVTAFDAAFKVT